MAGAPLEVVRVIAVEQFGAVPFGTLQLADLGAEVIRLEDSFDSFNRGKRSLHLDLESEAGEL